MRQKFVILVSTCIAVGSTSIARTDESVEAVLNHAIDAHGGREALTKYKAGRSKLKGTLHTPEGEVDFTQEVVYMNPGKVKQVHEAVCKGQSVRVMALINGDNDKIEFNGQTADRNRAERELKEAAHFMRVGQLLPLVNEKGFDLSLLPGGDADKKAIGVRVRAQGHRDIDLYFDKDSGLLSRVETRGVEDDKEFTETRVLSDYETEKESGLPYAKKIVVSRDGKRYMELEVLKITHLEHVDTQEFNLGD